ncbi:energy-coupled thiamine transporter ThiT [Atopobacter phocae]|uniref:energy-coupled thiamine transporter ThiT n=1 Tax=Atopobacter phocae TaxID=136492 RepID=UPI00046FB731|nr:energy-coupled thiamine transporter ThiT [Atopobacter phocae]
MSKATELVMEWVITFILCLVLSFIPPLSPIFGVFWMIIPLLWYAFRRGLAISILTGAIIGFTTALIKGVAMDHVVLALLTSVFPFATVGFAGFFSKFTIRTAFNRKLTSTMLNIVTGSFIGTLAFTVLLGISLYVESSTPIIRELYGLVPLNWNELAVLGLATWLIASLIFVVMLKTATNVFIPKYTIHLTRREKSHLLND